MCTFMIYILISYNHYYYVSCCAFYLHLVSLSWVLLFETKISGPWELLVTWLSSTICVSSCVLVFVSSPLTKHPPSSHLCDLLLLIRKLSLIEIKGKLLVQIFFHNSFLILQKQKYWYIQRIANYLNLWERKNDP